MGDAVRGFWSAAEPACSPVKCRRGVCKAGGVLGSSVSCGAVASSQRDYPPAGWELIVSILDLARLSGPAGE